jgi:hypothetical protein
MTILFSPANDHFRITFSRSGKKMTDYERTLDDLAVACCKLLYAPRSTPRPEPQSHSSSSPSSDSTPSDSTPSAGVPLSAPIAKHLEIAFKTVAPPTDGSSSPAPNDLIEAPDAYTAPLKRLAQTTTDVTAYKIVTHRFQSFLDLEKPAPRTWSRIGLERQLGTFKKVVAEWRKAQMEATLGGPDRDHAWNPDNACVMEITDTIRAPAAPAST